MKQLIFLLICIFIFYGCNKSEDQEYIEIQKKIEEARQKELLNTKISDTTIFDFRFGMTINEYVQNVNLLIKNNEFTGGPDIFYWDVNFKNAKDLKCKFEPSSNFIFRREALRLEPELSEP